MPESLTPLLRNVDGDRYMLALTDLPQIEYVLSELRNAHVVVEDLQLTEADLEDVFVDLVGR